MDIWRRTMTTLAASLAASAAMAGSGPAPVIESFALDASANCRTVRFPFPVRYSADGRFEGPEPLLQMLPPLNILVPDKSKLRIEQVNLLKEFKSAFGFFDGVSRSFRLILHTASIKVAG